MGHSASGDRAGTWLYLCFAKIAQVRAGEINTEKYSRLQMVVKFGELGVKKKKVKPEDYKICISAEDSTERDVMKLSRINCQLQYTNTSVIVAQRQEGSIQGYCSRLIVLFHCFKCLCASVSSSVILGCGQVTNFLANGTYGGLSCRLLRGISSPD